MKCEAVLSRNKKQKATSSKGQHCCVCVYAHVCVCVHNCLNCEELNTDFQRRVSPVSAATKLPSWNVVPGSTHLTGVQLGQARGSFSLSTGPELPREGSSFTAGLQAPASCPLSSRVLVCGHRRPALWELCRLTTNLGGHSVASTRHVCPSAVLAHLGFDCFSSRSRHGWRSQCGRIPAGLDTL